MTPLRDAVRRVAPDLPLYDLTELQQRLEGQAARDRFLAVVMAIFATLALGLASVGPCGVVAFGVAQRRRELGIRLALGAQRGQVLALILRQAMALVGAGAVAGVVASLFLAR